MPQYLLMLLSYLFLLFSLSCSSQSFNGKNNKDSSKILSKDALADRDSTEDQLEPEEEDVEEDIVAVPPAVISGSYLVCETLSSDSANRTAELSCYFERDGNKLDISSVEEFDIKITDEHDNNLDFSYSIIDNNLIFKVELQDSNKIAIAILDARTGAGQRTEPMDALELAEISEPANNEQIQAETPPIPEEEPEEAEAPQEAESAPVMEESAAAQQAEIEYVIILMPGESIDTDSANTCTLNELFCLFFQRDRNLVVRNNPGGLRAGATGTNRDGSKYDYTLKIKPNQDLCIETVNRSKKSRDFCFDTQNQFTQDPMLILTNLGELKLVGADPTSGINIITPGEFNPF